MMAEKRVFLSYFNDLLKDDKTLLLMGLNISEKGLCVNQELVSWCCGG
jgi:hypothetical protein